MLAICQKAVSSGLILKNFQVCVMLSLVLLCMLGKLRISRSFLVQKLTRAKLTSCRPVVLFIFDIVW